MKGRRRGGGVGSKDAACGGKGGGWDVPNQRCGLGEVG